MFSGKISKIKANIYNLGELYQTIARDAGLVMNDNFSPACVRLLPLNASLRSSLS